MTAAMVRRLLAGPSSAVNRTSRIFNVYQALGLKVFNYLQRSEDGME